MINFDVGSIANIVIIIGAVFSLIKFIILPFIKLCNRLLILETRSKYYDINLEKNLVSAIHDHLTPIEDSYFDRYDYLTLKEQYILINLLEIQKTQEITMSVKKICLIQLIAFLNSRIAIQKIKNAKAKI
jgi:hypothetical protein